MIAPLLSSHHLEDCISLIALQRNCPQPVEERNELQPCRSKNFSHTSKHLWVCPAPHPSHGLNVFPRQLLFSQKVVYIFCHHHQDVDFSVHPCKITSLLSQVQHTVVAGTDFSLTEILTSWFSFAYSSWLFYSCIICIKIPTQLQCLTQT